MRKTVLLMTATALLVALVSISGTLIWERHLEREERMFRLCTEAIEANFAEAAYRYCAPFGLATPTPTSEGEGLVPSGDGIRGRVE